MSKFEPNEKVMVNYDDANPHLNKTIVTVVRQMTNTSPYWIEVEHEGNKYPIRGSEVRRIRERKGSKDMKKIQFGQRKANPNNMTGGGKPSVPKDMGTKTDKHSTLGLPLGGHDDAVDDDQQPSGSGPLQLLFLGLL